MEAMESSPQNDPRPSPGAGYSPAGKAGGVGLSTAARLAVYYGLVLAATALAVHALAYLSLKSSIEEHERAQITARLDDYASDLRRGGVELLERTFNGERRPEAEAYFARLSGRGMNALFLSDSSGHPEESLQLVSELDPVRDGAWVRMPTPSGSTTVFVASREVSPGRFLQVGRTTNAEAALLREFRSIFLKVLLPVVLLGAAGGALVGRRALRPLRTLAHTAREITRTGDLKKRVAVPASAGELGQLASGFNEMLARNDRLVTGIRQSLDNVAHDLRTPMTRLRSTAEAALTGGQAGAADPAAAREALADCLEESDRVLASLDALLDVAEAETGTMRLKPAPVDLAELAREAAEVFEFVAEEGDVTIAVDAPAPVPALLDRARARQVVANLTDNAIKFSGPGGTVTLRATAHPGTGRPAIEVEDHGPGIPPGEESRIWDRLYRSDHSRHRRGLGLGLSLVKAITEAHGGTTSVRATAGGGATFSVAFPPPPADPRQRPAGRGPASGTSAPDPGQGPGQGQGQD